VKKLLFISVASIILLFSTSSVFATNTVSDMATTKGGQHIAECAQKMDNGISGCVKVQECSTHTISQ